MSIIAGTWSIDGIITEKPVIHPESHNSFSYCVPSRSYLCDASSSSAANLDWFLDQFCATPCSVMSPNDGRFDLLNEMIRGFSVDGVYDLTWQACHTYNVEAYRINAFVQETFGFPTLHLETDYAESDTEQLRVRTEAYPEML